MKVIATNIAQATTFIWNGKEETTGIYKKTVEQPIYLGKENVQDDEVSDRIHHGGEFKACYLFSSDYYTYWKDLYPNLEWNWGMFGENLTLEGLDENQLHIGDIYQLGDCKVQITQAREPCYKLGVKFGNPKVISQFIAHNHPGTYVRILKEGFVRTGDRMKLIEKATNSISIPQYLKLLCTKDKNQEHIKLAIQQHALPPKKITKLRSFLKANNTI
jgi:MOSC domain-containing protein YiiM